MAHTYTCLYFHVIFSTKFRHHWLTESIQADLWPYFGGIAKQNDIFPLAIGGFTDHMHLLLRTKPTMPISRMLQLLKGGSSWWIHQTYPHLSSFTWQDGYGAFSISEADLEGVTRYIAGQAEHHRKKTFKEEYVEFLEAHKIEYDPRYVWD